MEKKFKPFDKVIVREDIFPNWTCGFYSHYDVDTEKHVTTVLTRVDDKDILPYEGNEYLIGTTDVPEEEVRLEKEERIICNNDVDLLVQGIGFLTTFSYSYDDAFYTGKGKFANADYSFVIRFKDFNPFNIEETKKHILCIKNGKIVRYKF